MEASEGFPPIAGDDARVLVLGSLPGQKSLLRQQYYAHPQNAFWPIMAALFGVRGTYTERSAGLISSRIAIWDVLQSSARPGSLDADIRLGTAVANDFSAFLAANPGIAVIAFNGRKAEQLFRRMVAEEITQHCRLVGLPSTSPAYAAMPFEGKLNAWRAGIQQALAIGKET